MCGLQRVVLLPQTHKGRLTASFPQTRRGCHVQPQVTCSPRKGSGWSNSAPWERLGHGNSRLDLALPKSGQNQASGHSQDSPTGQWRKPMSSCSGSLNNVTSFPQWPHVERDSVAGSCPVPGWGRTRGKGAKARGEERPRASQAGATRSSIAESGSPSADCFHSLVGAGLGSRDRWRKWYLTKTWLGRRSLSTGPEGLPRPEAQR